MNTEEKILIIYIKAVYGEICGPTNSRILYYRNIHPSRSILVTIRKHWVYNNQTEEDVFDKILSSNYGAGPEPNDKDVLMGCPIPGPTSQRFDWDVIKAVFV